MARKVFISFLGTGFYYETTYGDISNGVNFAPTRFAQKATLEYLKANEWSKDDQVIIMLTERARTSNWDVPDNKRIRPKTEQEEEYIGLHTVIDEMNLPCTVTELNVPDGKTENEMWEIFELIFDQLQNKDELYLDVTHAFRYLPMFLLVLCNYAKFLKEVEVAHISYGNVEGKVDGVAPIMDLLPLSLLQDWTFAAANYLENGYAGRLKDLTKRNMIPILSDSKRRTLNDENLVNFVNYTEYLSLERITCRGKGVMSGMRLASVKDVANIIEENSVAIPPLKPIIRKLADTLENADTSDLQKFIDAANWCCRMNLYQQSVTFLQEGIITFFCQRHGLDILSDKERKLINYGADVQERGTKEETWIENLKFDDIEYAIGKMRELLADEVFDKPFAAFYNKIVKLRNDYNHCGMNTSALENAIKFKNNVIEYLGNSQIQRILDAANRSEEPAAE